MALFILPNTHKLIVEKNLMAVLFVVLELSVKEHIVGGGVCSRRRRRCARSRRRRRCARRRRRRCARSRRRRCARRRWKQLALFILPNTHTLIVEKNPFGCSVCGSRTFSERAHWRRTRRRKIV